MDSSIRGSAIARRPAPVLGFGRVTRAVGHFTLRHRLAAVGGLVVAFFLLTGLLAPMLAPRDPDRISLRDTLQPPSAQYLLGTDNNGRDLLSRVIFGARTSLLIAITAVVVGMSIGVTLGALAAWSRRLNAPIMRVMDILLCFPSIITALTIIAVLGPGLSNLIIAIAVYQVPQFARLTQGLTQSVKQEAYVEAAVAAGVPDSRILSRHILPNILAPIVVQVSLLIPSAIMITASLSFLGLGIKPPTAEWGSMLQGSMEWARLAPHVMIFPGLALMLVVFGFNTLGDGLRAALDPRMRHR